MLNDLKDSVRWAAMLIGCIVLVLGSTLLAEFQFQHAAMTLLLSAGCAVVFAVVRAEPNSTEDRSDFGIAKLIFLGFGVLFTIGGLYSAGDGDIVLAARALGEALFLGFCCWIARRYELGWFIDANGERQKVNGINRGRVFYVPTTWDLRSAEEFEFRRERRIGLTILAFYVAIELDALDNVLHAAHPNAVAVLLLICGVVTGPLALFMLAVLIVREAAYLLGYQDMKGAKVLDPEPRRMGLDAVTAQKALGDAQFATPAEARELLARES